MLLILFYVTISSFSYKRWKRWTKETDETNILVSKNFDQQPSCKGFREMLPLVVSGLEYDFYPKATPITMTSQWAR